MTPEEWAGMSPVERMIYKDVKRRQRNDTQEGRS